MAEEEKIYFDEGNVKVTRARFIVPGQTHAMSGVTSVRASKNQPVKGPAIMGGVGVLLLFGGEIGVMAFGALLIVGAVLWYLKGAEYIVVLSSASGEAEALSSKNADWIDRIINALNDAIVDRG